MKNAGMTIVVKNIAKLVIGFILVFGTYIALTGHLAPGGGFSGAVIIAAATVLTVLAFGGAFSRKLVTEGVCHVWDGIGALAFLAVALAGYGMGAFFMNFVPVTPEMNFQFVSAGMIPLANLAILFKVGAGISGVMLALFAVHRVLPKE
ncbi:MAG TPA: MnhB domain-containing protein [Planctomycetota bacterium]|nr:MnhB domain-containing protein [Planctomycetota bacterium]